MSHVISTRLEDDVFFSLESISEKRHRKISEIIKEALTHYIDNYADYHLALDRLNDHNDEVIDSAEMKRRLEWV